MKLSIEVTSESTNTEVDFAIETLKAYREMRELVAKSELKAEQRVERKAEKASKSEQNATPNGNPPQGFASATVTTQPSVQTALPPVMPFVPHVPQVMAPVAQPVSTPVSAPAMPAVPQVAPPMFKSPTGRIEHAVTNLSAPVAPGQAPDMFSPSNMALLAERKVQAERTASAQQAHTAPPFSPVVAPAQQMNQPAPTPVFQIANPNQVVAFSPPTFR